MCKTEKDKTLASQALQFDRNREKCFSPDIRWIKARVMDGKFNNSLHKPGRYEHLLEYMFTIESEKAFVKCRKEWKTHIRQLNKLKLIEVKEHGTIYD